MEPFYFLHYKKLQYILINAITQLISDDLLTFDIQKRKREAKINIHWNTAHNITKPLSFLFNGFGGRRVISKSLQTQYHTHTIHSHTQNTKRGSHKKNKKGVSFLIFLSLSLFLSITMDLKSVTTMDETSDLDSQHSRQSSTYKMSLDSDDSASFKSTLRDLAVSNWATTVERINIREDNINTTRSKSYDFRERRDPERRTVTRRSSLLVSIYLYKHCLFFKSKWLWLCSQNQRHCCVWLIKQM